MSITVKRINYQRVQKYHLEDLLLEIKVQTLNDKAPLLSSLFEAISGALEKIIEELELYCRTFRTDDLDNQIYVTLMDDQLLHSINSANFSIHEDRKIVIEEFLESVESFVQSNKGFIIDPSFRIHVSIVCLDHVRDMKDELGRHKRGPQKVAAFEIDKSTWNYWCFNLPGKIFDDKNLDSYKLQRIKNNCLIVAVAVGLAQLKDASKYQKIRHVVLKKQTKPKLKTALTEIFWLTEEVFRKCPTIAREGPHDLESSLKILTKELGFQVYVYSKNVERLLLFRWPLSLDFSLPQVHLYLDEQGEKAHIYLIHRKDAFVNRIGRYFCPGCSTLVNTHATTHKCLIEKSCFACHRFFQREEYFVPPDNVKTHFCDGELMHNSGPNVECGKCNVVCATPNCKVLHRSVCNTNYYCKKCDTYLVKNSASPNREALKKNHKCSMKTCRSCFESITTTGLDGDGQKHLCKLQQPKLPVSHPKLVFVVFESEVNNEGIIEPFFATLFSETQHSGLFDLFRFSKESEFLGKDHVKEPDILFKDYWGYECRPTFAPAKNVYGSQLAKNFLHFQEKGVKSTKEKLKAVGVQVLASILTHSDAKLSIIVQNSEAMSFILSAAEFLGLSPSPLMKARTITSIRLQKQDVTILNSESYFSLSLLELSNLYNLFEPFYFPVNAKFQDFRDYQGKVLSLKYWEEYKDSASDLESKSKVIEDHGESPFFYKTELMKYSKKKCHVLAAACLNLISEGIALQTNLKKIGLKGPSGKSSASFFHPFNFPTVTRPSFLMTVFLAFRKEPELLVVDREYIGGISSPMSRQEIIWLTYNMEMDAGRIHHNGISCKDGQKKFPGYPTPDNWIEDELGKVASYFHGCFWHNCPHQIKNMSPNRKKSLESRRREEERRIKSLEEKKIKTQITWECEFNREKKGIMKDWLEEKKYFHPGNRLVPREAVKSGFSEVYRYEWTQDKRPDHKLFALDINSIYPFVSLMEFGIGKPSILMHYEILDRVSITPGGLKVDGEPLMGLAYVRILPPRNGPASMFPFIQKKTKHGIISGLCSTCMEELSSEPCKHSEKERSWDQVMCSNEIEFALQNCYEILEIWEVHHFTKKAKVLSDFIRVIGRDKIRFEGVPDGLNAEKYCQFLNEEMGFNGDLKLQPKHMVKDTKQKAISKQSLVSFLGKFLQSAIKNRTEIVRDYGYLVDLHSRKKIRNIQVISNDSLLVSSEDNGSYNGPNRRTNCIIGSLILAESRKLLFSHILSLVKQNCDIYYTDTDSIIFEAPKDFNLEKAGIRISTCFGDFKEIFPKETIISFFCLSSKESDL